MKLKAKFEIEVEEHFDNEKDKGFIEMFKATDDEAVTAKLKEAMEDTLFNGGVSENIKVAVADWDTDFDV